MKDRSESKFLCVLVSALTALALSGCREQIVHDLNEMDANRLITRLSDSGVAAGKESQPDGKWSIVVDSGRMVEALRFIDSNRLIRNTGNRPRRSSSVISSREDQRFEYERSLSAEIESTLSSIDGVLEAKVHLNLPPLDPIFGRPENEAAGSGSVLVIMNNRDSLTEKEIGALVAGASGVSQKRIKVLIHLETDPAKRTENTIPEDALAQAPASAIVKEPSLFFSLAEKSRLWVMDNKAGAATALLVLLFCGSTPFVCSLIRIRKQRALCELEEKFYCQRKA